METTNQEVITFMNAAKVWVDKHEAAGGGHTPLKYAVRKVAKRAEKVLDKFREDVQDLNVDYAAVQTKDKHGNDIKDPVLAQKDDGSYIFTREGQKSWNTGYRKLVKAVVELDEHLVSEDQLPALSDAEREAFEGFVVHPVEEVDPSQVN